MLPMIPGMRERRSHDYARHGVTSLFAAFNTTDGTMIPALHHQHRAVEFKKFLITIHKAALAELDVHLLYGNRPPTSPTPGLAGQTPAVHNRLHLDRVVVDQPSRAGGHSHKQSSGQRAALAYRWATKFTHCLASSLLPNEMWSG